MFTEIPAGKFDQKRKEIFKKKIRKSLWEWKTDITFAPRKYGKFLEILREELEKKRFKNFKKKL